MADDKAEGAIEVKKLTTSQETWRKKAVLDELKLGDVPDAEVSHLHEFLVRNHTVSDLRPGERGETDLVTMSTDTGEAPPHRQPPCRMPFVVRQEMARQLQDMQRQCDTAFQLTLVKPGGHGE